LSSTGRNLRLPRSSHLAQPFGGFATETAGGRHHPRHRDQLRYPVGTRAITGAIVGVGSTQRLSAVRWGVTGRIVWAWVITIPASAAVAAATYGVLVLLGIEYRMG
jgi:PiT family inorganic phosphate transporter